MRRAAENLDGLLSLMGRGREPKNLRRHTVIKTRKEAAEAKKKKSWKDQRRGKARSTEADEKCRKLKKNEKETRRLTKVEGVLGDRQKKARRKTKALAESVGK